MQCKARLTCTPWQQGSRPGCRSPRRIWWGDLCGDLSSSSLLSPSGRRASAGHTPPPPAPAGGRCPPCSAWTAWSSWRTAPASHESPSRCSPRWPARGRPAAAGGGSASCCLSSSYWAGWTWPRSAPCVPSGVSRSSARSLLTRTVWLISRRASQGRLSLAGHSSHSSHWEHLGPTLPTLNRSDAFISRGYTTLHTIESFFI